MRFLNLFRRKPKHFQGLKPIHKDTNGLYWYEMTDSLNISLERYAKLQKFIVIWNRNLNSQELNELIDEANTCLEDGISKVASGKRMNAIKIASILNEIKSRQETIRPFEIMADLLAVQMIREDENPSVFDNIIHLEKKAYIQDCSKKKDPFFIHSTIFKGLTNSLLILKENFEEYLKESEAIKIAHQRTRELLATLK